MITAKVILVAEQFNFLFLQISYNLRTQKYNNVPFYDTRILNEELLKFGISTLERVTLYQVAGFGLV